MRFAASHPMTGALTIRLKVGLAFARWHVTTACAYVRARSKGQSSHYKIAGEGTAVTRRLGKVEKYIRRVGERARWLVHEDRRGHSYLHIA